MGHGTYSDDAYADRVAARTATDTPVFKHDDDIKKGRTAKKVHDQMSPKGTNRESRDSEEHPISIPIGVVFDTTGSMGRVPGILEANLPKLMGTFLDDKASGKKYLGDGYPAIMVGAIDDYEAQVNYYGAGDGSLQVGQFESGIEIDNDLERIWLTGNGGGTYSESYQLALYYFARHTAHDHFDKRGRRGYLFLIGDEHTYPMIGKQEVLDVIGDNLEADIPVETILAEVQQRYHVFFIIPNMTNHYNDENLLKDWQKLLPQQNVLRLDDPAQISQLIAATVALNEEHIGIADLKGDGLSTAISTALTPLAKMGSGLTKYDNPGLVTAGTTSGVENL